jgi:hypothetical protein
MNQWPLIILIGLLLFPQPRLFSADADEEQGLIQELQSASARPKERIPRARV